MISCLNWIITTETGKQFFREKSEIIFTNGNMVCNSSGNIYAQRVGVPNMFKPSTFF